MTDTIHAATATAVGASKAHRRLTTAQAVVAYLSQQYSSLDNNQRRLIPGLFGIFGHGNVVGLGQALEEVGQDLRYYQGKNEQAMVHAALGYAKATLRTATLACAGSVGPGATNLITGAATATANRLPVLLLPADTFVRRRHDPVLQQLENPMLRDVTANDAFRPVSRFFDRITHPEQLLDSLPAALRVLTDPAETGAVTISLPQDVQGEAFDFPAGFFLPRTWHIERREPTSHEVGAALDAIRKAERPMIIAGGGVRYSAAEAALVAFANVLGIPVSETHAGKGCAVGAEINVGVVGLNGTLAANRLAANSDLVIAIGTRLQDFTTGSRSLFQAPEVRFLSINVSAMDAFKVGAIPVVADARTALERLSSHMSVNADRFATESEYRASAHQELAEWSAQLSDDIAPRAGEKMGQAEVLACLNGLTKRGDVVVTAAGTPPADVSRLWDNSNGSECHTEFGFSCMGHEIPAGIGYRLARPRTGHVYVVIGDGTYLMNNTELVTAAQERLDITVILFENGGYQAIRGLQVGKTGVAFGNEFRYRDAALDRLEGEYLQVDYAQNAKSLGCRTWHTTSIDAFRAAVEEARSISGPKVIVAVTERFRMMSPTECFWDVGVAQTSQLGRVNELTEEHLRGRATQRYFSHTDADH